MTTEEIIDGMVEASFGHADLRTQYYFRQSLQVLVEMAKSEERQEIGMDARSSFTHAHRGMVH